MDRRELDGSETETTPRRGDLYWIEVPESNDDSAIAHPHLVVQDDVVNRSRVKTVVVMALSTNPKRASEPGNVLLSEGEGNLRRPSVIVVSRIDAVEKSSLGAFIGRLDETRVVQALDGLRFLQRSFEREG
jgi:mRNA interferase MazF